MMNPASPQLVARLQARCWYADLSAEVAAQILRTASWALSDDLLRVNTLEGLKITCNATPGTQHYFSEGACEFFGSANGFVVAPGCYVEEQLNAPDDMPRWNLCAFIWDRKSSPDNKGCLVAVPIGRFADRGSAKSTGLDLAMLLDTARDLIERDRTP